MTAFLPDHPEDPSPLPPPQPQDQPGVRPRFDLVGMVAQVVMIQTRLAEWRAARAGAVREKEKGESK